MAWPGLLASGLVLKGLEVALVAAIAVIAYRRDMLNAFGSFMAFIMGAAIVLATNFMWLLLLFSLLVIGSVATRFGMSEKEKRKVAEKDKGRRRSRNVIANGLTPTVFALAAPVIAARFGDAPATLAYVGAVATAASDTVASEIGSLSNRVYLITTFRRVPPGTDGGVSMSGTVAAFLGALALAVLGFAAIGLTGTSPAFPLSATAIAIVTVCGFAGCQLDSLLGATLEEKRLLTKEEVNLVSITAGGVLALVLAMAFNL